MNKEERKIRYKKIFIIFSFLFSFFSFLSYVFPQETIPLDSGALAYVFADIKGASNIIDLIPLEDLKRWQAVVVRNSTDTVIAALFAKESGRKYQVAGWGNYPSFRAGLALFLSPGWRRQKTNIAGRDYWYSKNEKLSVAIDSSQVYAVSWHTHPVNPMHAGSKVLLPDYFVRFKNSVRLVTPNGIVWNSFVSGWIVQPDPLFNKILNDEGYNVNLPVSAVLVKMYSSDNPAARNQFRFTTHLQFNDPAQAGNSMLVIKDCILQNNTSALKKVFFANEPVLNGNTIEINSAVLNDKDLTLLFNLVMLYWE